MPVLPHKIDPPSLSKSEEKRDDMLSAEQTEDILRYLCRYHYASFLHVTTELLWHTGMRRGAVRAIDLRDYYPDDQYVELHHRPDTGTPLKNKEDGERPVALSEDVCQVIDDWIADQRPDVTDDHGRHPLLATTHGRPHQTTIQTRAYAVSRPCFIGENCPHGEDPDDCDAAIRKNTASQCPSSVSTHALRRGALTHWLDSDWSVPHVSDRADVSPQVLKKHYDARSELSKMEQRRQNLYDI